MARLVEMRVPTTKCVDPLLGVSGDEREPETQAVVAMIEPPLPHRAGDEEHPDPVGPDDDYMGRSSVSSGERVWELSQKSKTTGTEHVHIVEAYPMLVSVREARLLQALAHLVVVHVQEAVQTPAAVLKTLVGGDHSLDRHTDPVVHGVVPADGNDARRPPDTGLAKDLWVGRVAHQYRDGTFAAAGKGNRGRIAVHDDYPLATRLERRRQS